jgi:hypothetical protein
MKGGEQWKFDARMGGGSLSLLAAYITDIISHILQENATRSQGQPIILEKLVWSEI